MLRADWNGNENEVPLIVVKEGHSPREMTDVEGEHSPRGQPTKATKVSILTASDLATTTEGGAGNKTAFDFRYSGHCKGDEFPVVKGQHTLFLNASYKRQNVETPPDEPVDDEPLSDEPACGESPAEETPDEQLCNCPFVVDLELPLTATREDSQSTMEKYDVEELLNVDTLDATTRREEEEDRQEKERKFNEGANRRDWRGDRLDEANVPRADTYRPPQQRPGLEQLPIRGNTGNPSSSAQAAWAPTVRPTPNMPPPVSSQSSTAAQGPSMAPQRQDKGKKRGVYGGKAAWVPAPVKVGNYG